jgi:hypothetical protein
MLCVGGPLSGRFLFCSIPNNHFQNVDYRSDSLTVLSAFRSELELPPFTDFTFRKSLIYRVLTLSNLKILSTAFWHFSHIFHTLIHIIILAVKKIATG